MAVDQDFDWPAGPKKLLIERPVFLDPGENLPALDYARTDAHPAASRSRRLFLATLIAIGHGVALLASQVIAAGIEQRHGSNDQVHDAAVLLDDAFPVMIGVHLIAVISTFLWALQRTPQRRTASLIAVGAFHCVCVFAWWTLYEMAA